MRKMLLAPVLMYGILSCRASVPVIVTPPEPSRPVFRGYEKAGADMIIDPVAGLAWAKAVSPRRMKLAAARTWTAGLKLGGFRDWRVPTYNELLTHQNNWSSSVPQEQTLDPETGEVRNPEYPEDWFRRFGFRIPQRPMDMNNYWTVTPAPEAVAILGGKAIYTPIFGPGFAGFDTAMLADHAEAYVWAVRRITAPATNAIAAPGVTPSPRRKP